MSYFDLSHLDAEATGIIRNLFRSRLELRRKLALFSVAGGATEECVNSMRNVLRAVRFAEDYVGEFQVKPRPFNEKNPAVAFAGAEPHTMVNSYYLPFDIETSVRSGDVLLSRGAAFTSAAIARIGDVDSQFSHAALVYIDPKTHEKYTIEAHIEIGVVVAPFRKYLKDGKVRSALFRFGDPELAHEAARIMYNKAKAAMDRGKNIPYDFSLEVKDPVYYTHLLNERRHYCNGKSERLEFNFVGAGVAVRC
ncbi:YiiX/YebB-like N1pC/P60 family cysteine hydrolase [Bdellovibrionota bacterium FG-2]